MSCNVSCLQSSLCCLLGLLILLFINTNIETHSTQLWKFKVKLTLHYLQTNKIKALKYFVHVYTRKNLYGIKDSLKYLMPFYSEILVLVEVAYLSVKWTNKVYSMIQCFQCLFSWQWPIVVKWIEYFSFLKWFNLSPLIISSPDHLCGENKNYLMNNFKMHQSLSWYISSVRLEGFIRSKRELKYFLQEGKVSFT